MDNLPNYILSGKPKFQAFPRFTLWRGIADMNFLASSELKLSLNTIFIQ
jgi:hypothetical protein